VLRALAADTPTVLDRVRLLDSVPVPHGASRETVRHSELTGYADRSSGAPPVPRRWTGGAVGCPSPS